MRDSEWTGPTCSGGLIEADGKPTYVVERASGEPYLLAQLRASDVSRACSPLSDWKDDPGLLDMLYDSSGELVDETYARWLARSWGREVPEIPK